jgi:ABC-type histidine transport system ATPase subunit
MSTQHPKELLRVSGLRKHFGNQEILKGIDLTVNPGDRIAFTLPQFHGNPHSRTNSTVWPSHWQ